MFGCTLARCIFRVVVVGDVVAVVVVVVVVVGDVVVVVVGDDDVVVVVDGDVDSVCIGGAVFGWVFLLRTQKYRHVIQSCREVR